MTLGMTNEGVKDVACRGNTMGNGGASNRVTTEEEVDPHGNPDNPTSSLSEARTEHVSAKISFSLLSAGIKRTARCLRCLDDEVA